VSNTVDIIAVILEEDLLLNAERKRLSAWAPANGWKYLEYVDEVDLLARISDLNGEVIDQIEIVAHGNPAECDDIGLGNVTTFGQSLRRLAGFSRSTVVFLSGCNTGLEFLRDCIARSLAAACETAVCGAQGYLAGTHAEGNERCVPSFTHASVLYEPFTGGLEARGEDVWRRFGPRLKSANGGDMDVKISTSGFRPINLGPDQAKRLKTAVEDAIQRPSAESAPFRIAPDLRFAISLADGEHIFEMLAGGTVLRDPVTRRVWQLQGGRALLESLWPFRSGAMPAA
jgi:hypothetical protein